MKCQALFSQENKKNINLSSAIFVIVYCLNFGFSNLTLLFQARFTAYDSVNPMQIAVSELTIRVLRNQNGPIFNPSRYDETIADTYNVGGVVLRVTANDADGVSVIFGI